MKSGALGETTSGPEITNISSHGIWLLFEKKEYFLSFEEYPWFKTAKIEDITSIEEPSPGHFHWPNLDIDLGINSIESPEKYPLKAK